MHCLCCLSLLSLNLGLCQGFLLSLLPCLGLLLRSGGLPLRLFQSGGLQLHRGGLLPCLLRTGGLLLCLLHHGGWLSRTGRPLSHSGGLLLRSGGHPLCRGGLLLRSGGFLLRLLCYGDFLLCPGGPQSRLLRPGGLRSHLHRPGGLLSRLLRPGGLLSRLLRPGGLLSRLLRPGGLRSRLFSPGGLRSCLLHLGTLLCRLWLGSWSHHFHMDLALRPSPGSTSASPPSWIVLCLGGLCHESCPCTPGYSPPEVTRSPHRLLHHTNGSTSPKTKFPITHCTDDTQLITLIMQLITHHTVYINHGLPLPLCQVLFSV